MFPKIVGFPPKSSILIGFSIIFTTHFGGPLFLETPTYPLNSISTHLKSAQVLYVVFTERLDTKDDSNKSRNLAKMQILKTGEMPSIQIGGFWSYLPGKPSALFLRQ